MPEQAGGQASSIADWLPAFGLQMETLELVSERIAAAIREWRPEAAEEGFALLAGAINMGRLAGMAWARSPRKPAAATMLAGCVRAWLIANDRDGRGLTVRQLLEAPAGELALHISRCLCTPPLAGDVEAWARPREEWHLAWDNESHLREWSGREVEEGTTEKVRIFTVEAACGSLGASTQAALRDPRSPLCWQQLPELLLCIAEPGQFDLEWASGIRTASRDSARALLGLMPLTRSWKAAPAGGDLNGRIERTARIPNMRSGLLECLAWLCSPGEAAKLMPLAATESERFLRNGWSEEEAEPAADLRAIGAKALISRANAIEKGWRDIQQWKPQSIPESTVSDPWAIMLIEAAKQLHFKRQSEISKGLREIYQGGKSDEPAKAERTATRAWNSMVAPATSLDGPIILSPEALEMCLGRKAEMADIATPERKPMATAMRLSAAEASPAKVRAMLMHGPNGLPWPKPRSYGEASSSQQVQARRRELMLLLRDAESICRNAACAEEEAARVLDLELHPRQGVAGQAAWLARRAMLGAPWNLGRKPGAGSAAEAKLLSAFGCGPNGQLMPENLPLISYTLISLQGSISELNRWQGDLWRDLRERLLEPERASEPELLACLMLMGNLAAAIRRTPAEMMQLLQDKESRQDKIHACHLAGSIGKRLNEPMLIWNDERKESAKKWKERRREKKAPDWMTLPEEAEDMWLQSSSDEWSRRMLELL